MRGLGSNRKLRVAICGMLSGRKRRIAREACRADCPSWKPCGVVPAGTGEGISARIHAANSQGDKAEEGRRSARRHNANSLGVRVESCVSLVAGIVVGVSRARGVESSIIICKARNVKNADCQWVHHPTCHPRTLPGRAASGGALATETKRATGQSSYGLSWKTGGAFFFGSFIICPNFPPKPITTSDFVIPRFPGLACSDCSLARGPYRPVPRDCRGVGSVPPPKKS